MSVATETDTTAQRPASPDAWYSSSAEEVTAKLSVDPAVGLSSRQAADLLERNGPNALPVEQSVPGWKRFIGQYRSYMQVILVGAAIVSLAIKEWSTGVLLLLITVINAVVGLRQEGKAESAMNALQAMVKASARVRRDGSEANIPAEEVVVGDIVLLAAGDEVPADGRLIEASALQIDESALTGESVPVSKGTETPSGTDLAPADQTDMAFMHTPVTHGSGVIVVTATGSETQVGRIAGMLATTTREQTPLTKQLNTLTLWIVAAAGVTMVVMFVLGAQRDQSSTVIFTSAVALAIAAIPEAMPTVLQVVMSLGAAELARRGAVLKDLASVETLGSTSAINSDKTGTLTMNQMTAVEVIDPTDRYTISGSGYELEGKVQRAAGSGDTIEDAILPYVIANDAKLVDGKVVGDPTEGALLVLAYKVGLDIEATRDRHPRLATLPFDPTYKLMATFTRLSDDGVRCYVKGAAPAVMSHAATALSDGQSVAWDEDLRSRAEADIRRMGEGGLRVMAAAYRDISGDSFDPTGDLLAYVEGLEMTSLVGMVDPPREASKQAVHDAQKAHIRVRMVTGDDVVTGAAIAKQLNIDGEAILGAEFAALSEAERLERIDEIGVVGRVAPEHKVLLVDTLKQKGHVVAMTGDGVNDAPSIKAAHIGIAMGSGTEVAKNAGRMILTDDDFATIVYAVEQGRKLYDNLTKYVRFVLISLVAFVLTFLGATLLNIAAGQPFTPPQVLWIHFFISAPFGVALGLDQATPGLMRLHPRPSDQSIMTTAVKLTAGLVGLYMAICLDLLIYFGKQHYHSVAVGSSIGLTAFALMLVVAAYESRGVSRSVLESATFDNAQMNWIAIAEIALAVMVTQMDLFNRLLDTVPLRAGQFGLALASAVLLLALWEVGKLIARRQAAGQHARRRASACGGRADGHGAGDQVSPRGCEPAGGLLEHRRWRPVADAHVLGEGPVGAARAARHDRDPVAQRRLRERGAAAGRSCHPQRPASLGRLCLPFRELAPQGAMERLHVGGGLGAAAVAEIVPTLQDLASRELVHGANTEIQRSLDARESQDHRARSPQPAHAQTAPGDLAQRPRRQHAFWHVRQHRDPRLTVETQLVEHGVLDDGQLVFGCERGEALPSVCGRCAARGVVAGGSDVNGVNVLALKQLPEPVDAQARAIALNRECLAARAGDRIERAGVPGRLDGDPSAVGRRHHDREADRFLRAVCDQYLLG